MITITINEQTQSFESGVLLSDVLEAFGIPAETVFSTRVNGKLLDADEPVTEDGTLELITFQEAMRRRGFSRVSGTEPEDNPPSDASDGVRQFYPPIERFSVEEDILHILDLDPDDEDRPLSAIDDPDVQAEPELKNEAILRSAAEQTVGDEIVSEAGEIAADEVEADEAATDEAEDAEDEVIEMTEESVTDSGAEAVYVDEDEEADEEESGRVVGTFGGVADFGAFGDFEEFPAYASDEAEEEADAVYEAEEADEPDEVEEVADEVEEAVDEVVEEAEDTGADAEAAVLTVSDSEFMDFLRKDEPESDGLLTEAQEEPAAWNPRSAGLQADAVEEDEVAAEDEITEAAAVTEAVDEAAEADADSGRKHGVVNYSEQNRKRRQRRRARRVMIAAALVIALTGVGWAVGKMSLKARGQANAPVSGSDVVSPSSVSASDVSGSDLPAMNDHADGTPVFDAQKLRFGISNGLIGQVQTRLCSLGYLDPDNTSELYGHAMADAVERFREVNGISVEGDLDKKTFALLFSDKAKPAPTEPTVGSTTATTVPTVTTTESTTTEPTETTTKKTTKKTTRKTTKKTTRSTTKKTTRSTTKKTTKKTTTTTTTTSRRRRSSTTASTTQSTTITTTEPTTEKPTTEKPTTQKPTTEKPTTEKPTTQKPTTEKPTTEKPTTQKPTTEKTTQKTTTKEPAPKPTEPSSPRSDDTGSTTVED